MEVSRLIADDNFRRNEFLIRGRIRYGLLHQANSFCRNSLQLECGRRQTGEVAQETFPPNFEFGLKTILRVHAWRLALNP